MRSYDASTRTDLPVPFGLVADLVTHLRQRTDRLVLIGAVARDLLASAAGGLPVTRATLYVDIAIAVDTPSAYDDLGEVRLRRTQPHHELHGAPVDVVPFGGLETDRRVLFANDHLLDVTGMAEACEHAVMVTLPGGSTAPVASLEAQTVLKLLAWRDRGTPSHRKDALDLVTIFEAAASGVYVDDLYTDPALEAQGFDLTLAGAHRLGRDAARTLGPDAHASVLRVVEDDEGRERLSRAMNTHLAGRCLLAYLRGFTEGR